MKRSFLLLVTVLITNSTIIFAAGVRYDAKVWRTVQTYELAILSKNLDAHMRELLAVKCNFRGKDIQVPFSASRRTQRDHRFCGQRQHDLVTQLRFRLRS